MHYKKCFTHSTLFDPHSNSMRNTIITNTLQTRKPKYRGCRLFTEGPPELELAAEPCSGALLQICLSACGQAAAQFFSFVGHT